MDKQNTFSLVKLSLFEREKLKREAVRRLGFSFQISILPWFGGNSAMPEVAMVTTDGHRSLIVNISPDISGILKLGKFRPLKIGEPFSVPVKKSPVVSGKGKQIIEDDLLLSTPKKKFDKDVSSISGDIAGVIRDYRGRFLCAYGSSCLHWDVTKLELSYILSFKNFLQGWMFEAKGLIIEGDNYNVIKFIQNLVNKGEFIVDLGKGIDFSF
ncbi:hypothetical protein MA16_Dca000755 [Dendrobium catenatum]|uniref:RNase H type-1 domain-containing protein n=1 Tax=Dendrobium catenatum TaxID=906689 RepID=A0A2I0WUS1_9ASPA|nr:hypothetical protein MA16_Dca000755 [Dendrobium catenatum]